MTPEQLTQAFGDLAQSDQTFAILVLIAANLFIGVVRALKDGEFSMAELGGILRKVAPYFGSFIGVGLTGEAIGNVFGDALTWGVTVLAGAPFAAGALKATSSLTGIAMDNGVGRMLGVAPAVSEPPIAPDEPAPEPVPTPPAAPPPLPTLPLTFEDKVVAFVMEMNRLSLAHRAKEITDDEAAARYANLQALYPGIPGFPPGWPKAPV